MPSLLKRYKRAELEIYKRISAAFARRARGIAASWSRFIRGGSQSVSILVVAHSEEPPRGIRISFFGLAGAAMLAVAVVILIFAFSGGLGGARARVSASSPRRSICSRPTPGPATCASSKT